MAPATMTQQESEPPAVSRTAQEVAPNAHQDAPPQSAASTVSDFDDMDADEHLESFSPAEVMATVPQQPEFSALIACDEDEPLLDDFESVPAIGQDTNTNMGLAGALAAQVSTGVDDGAAVCEECFMPSPDHEEWCSALL